MNNNNFRSQKPCNICQKMISSTNMSRHVATHTINQINEFNEKKMALAIKKVGSIAICTTSKLSGIALALQVKRQ